MLIREYATAISGAAGTITGGAACRGTGGTQDGDHDGVAPRRHVPTLAPPRRGRADERAGADPRGNHGSAQAPGAPLAMGPQERPESPGVESAENTAKKQPRRRGAGSLFQRGGVLWIAYYRGGRLVRESAK